MQLRREDAVNANWPILVYATKLLCATRQVTLAILSRDKVARQNRAMTSVPVMAVMFIENVSKFR